MEFGVQDRIWIRSEAAGVWNGWHGYITEHHADGTYTVSVHWYNRTHIGSAEHADLQLAAKEMVMWESKATQDNRMYAEFERYGTE